MRLVKLNRKHLWVTMLITIKTISINPSFIPLKKKEAKKKKIKD